MSTLRKIVENFKDSFQGELRFDEPMSHHTTFKVGGPADLWVKPFGDDCPKIAAEFTHLARNENVPLFILGGGANLVVADKGIRGIVLDCTGWSGCTFQDDRVTIRSGTLIDDAIEEAALRGLSGLEFLAGMPGSYGGAIWMNARCYGFSISDKLIETEILDESLQRQIIPFNAKDFDYKKSPFQNRDVLILSGTFRLEKKPIEEIRSVMEDHRNDRETKGHFTLPSAGSSFKNNTAFGKPTGKIIDELGLRGLTIGGAKVADWHGNIIVNTGNATAKDIRDLVESITLKAKAELSIELEPEILFVGDWEE
ncbi:MAG: UDP-N-acetylmuramate dehydrogenase [Treponema sp.]|nr:UDP-N-acetylmuramate dehydrogenase [Treponema sp.]